VRIDLLHNRARLGLRLCALASLKLATNTALWERRKKTSISTAWVVDGTASIDQLGEAIFQMMLDCASGVASKAKHTLRAKRVRAVAGGCDLLDGF